jgi:hypothetical protein
MFHGKPPLVARVQTLPRESHGAKGFLVAGLLKGLRHKASDGLWARWKVILFAPKLINERKLIGVQAYCYRFTINGRPATSIGFLSF